MGPSEIYQQNVSTKCFNKQLKLRLLSKSEKRELSRDFVAEAKAALKRLEHERLIIFHNFSFLNSHGFYGA
jgi:hypothetical protein